MRRIMKPASTASPVQREPELLRQTGDELERAGISFAPSPYTSSPARPSRGATFDVEGRQQLVAG